MATTLLQGLARVVGPFQATPPPPADRRGAASGAAAASGGRRSGGRRVTFAADLGDESEFYLVELPNNRVYRVWGATRPEVLQDRFTDRWLIDGRPPHAFEIWGDDEGLHAFLAETAHQHRRRHRAQQMQAAQKAAVCVLQLGAMLATTLGLAAMRRRAA